MKAFLLKTVKRLRKEASWRSSELKKTCVQLIAILSDDPAAREAENTDVHDIELRAGAPASVVSDVADPYFYVLRAALESRQTRLMDIGLDALHYLIEHDYLKGKEVLDEVSGMTLMDDVIETVCRCEDEYDEVIQLQKIKVLLTAVTSCNCEVHGASLLLSLRSCFHIHLISKNVANKTTAKAALTQMLDIINQRFEVQSLKKTKSKELLLEEAESLANSRNASSLNVTVDEVAGHQAEGAGEGASFESLGVAAPLVAAAERALEGVSADDVVGSASNEVISFESAAPNTSPDTSQSPLVDGTGSAALATAPESEETAAAGGGRENGGVVKGRSWSSVEEVMTSFKSVFHRDAFLAFRALCRLSMKGLHDESEDAVHSDSIALKNKILSLELILHILKHCGTQFMRDEKLIHVIRTYLCVSLLSNCTSHEVVVVSLSLQVFLALMENFKEHLKSELEIFITTIFLRILESENSSSDHKARVLEVFINICKDHILLVEIFVNYDCDFEAIDLFRRIVDGFAKIAKSQVKGGIDSQTLRVMGLEGLVVVLRSLLHSSYFGVEGEDESATKALNNSSHNSSSNNLPSTPRIERRNSRRMFASGSGDEAEMMTAENSDDPSLPAAVVTALGIDAVGKFDRKKKIQEEIETGILKFNQSPKKGLAYLVSLGHLEMTPKNVALFFRQYQDRLDKTVVGEFLGREPEYEQGFCIKVLHEYVDSMEFADMKFDEAIRFFLSGFRLPGEAQKIDRLMEKFAERYFLQNRNEFASADMAFILAFSTIMLQTNLHNPAIKDDKRMTKEQFIKQNKGISPDGELSDDLLSEIYDRISLHPISLTKDDAKVRKQEEGGLRHLLSSADTKRKELFSDERREMVKAGEAMFKQKLRSKLGSTFVHTSKESDEEYVRPMFEVCWAPMIGVFGQILETSDGQKQVELCIKGISYGVRLAGRLDFSIVRHTYMNALAKYTTLDSTREITNKNIRCIRATVAIALMEGDFLHESWMDVLKCLSQMDRLSLLVHGMRNDETSSTVSTTSRKSLQRTVDKDPITKLFMGHTKAEAMRIVDEYNAEMLEDTLDPEELERIFLYSQNLSGDAVYVFVQSLCAVSLQEINASIPRVFTLQKLVEVADFNMGSRARLDWDRIWSLLAEHFTTVGIHKNLTLAMYAVDSLKQLSIKFLQKTELANFNFQRKFLKPFETILSKSHSYQIKDLVIRCLDILIQACAGNIRSGWRSIFSIFEIAAALEKYEVAALAFAVTERLIKTQFDLLIFDFVELMNCLMAFVAGPHSLLSLSAISHVSTCAQHLANGDVAQALDAQHNYQDTLSISWEKSSQRVEDESGIGEDTSVFRLWWPLLLGLSTRASDPRKEIRVQALETLHKVLSQYGQLFSAQTWNVIFKGVLFPMIDSVLTDSAPTVASHFPTQHTTLSDAHRLGAGGSMGYQVLSVCLSLFHQHRFPNEGGGYILLPELLTLLQDCVCQDVESLATIGAHALKDFIKGFQKGDALTPAAADLICKRLQTCLQRNLVYDFSEAGIVKVRDTDVVIKIDEAAALDSENELAKKTNGKAEVDDGKELEDEDVENSGILTTPTPPLTVHTAYGDGVLLDPAPATGDLPPRSRIQLTHGAILYTSADSNAFTTFTPSSASPAAGTGVDDADFTEMFTPELSTDQAWMALAAGAMTSMVVTLDLIESVGEILQTFELCWTVKHISVFLQALQQCHAHAHAFNHNTSLRINLKLAGFMKFPDNLARLPHLLDQEIDALMQILAVTTRLYHTKDQDTRALVSTWFSRACATACVRYASYDATTVTSSDKFNLDQLQAYLPPVLLILEYLLSLEESRFIENIDWIVPLLSALVVVADRRVRQGVAEIYVKQVNPFIVANNAVVSGRSIMSS